MKFNHKMTPEHELWASVLRTFVIDASRKRMTKHRAEELTKDVRSDDVAYICELVGMDHGAFVDEVTSIVKERLAAPA